MNPERLQFKIVLDNLNPVIWRREFASAPEWLGDFNPLRFDQEHAIKDVARATRAPRKPKMAEKP